VHALYGSVAKAGRKGLPSFDLLLGWIGAAFSMFPLAAASCQLEDEACGIDARSLSARSMTLTRSASPTDLAEMYIECERAPSLRLVGDQRDGLLHHPGVDRHDHPEALCDVKKRTRREQLAQVAPQSHEQFVLAEDHLLGKHRRLPPHGFDDFLSH
jgi:hypothetical protein